jgi:SAM-dependent methyltransferase
MATTASTAPAREGVRAAQVGVPCPDDPTTDAWMAVPILADRVYGAVRPYIGGLVLEAGSGTATLAEQLLGEGHEVYLSDPVLHHCHRLRKRFALLSHCRGVLPLDLGDTSFGAAYPHLHGQCGTVVAINTSKQVANDTRAIANAYMLLRPGGHLIALLAGQSPDRSRRSARRQLRAHFASSDLDMVRLMHLNLASRTRDSALSRLLTWWGRLLPVAGWSGRLDSPVIAVGRARSVHSAAA